MFLYGLAIARKCVDSQKQLARSFSLPVCFCQLLSAFAIQISCSLYAYLFLYAVEFDHDKSVYTAMVMVRGVLEEVDVSMVRGKRR